MKTLVIGGGGREHAIAWRLSLSPSVTQVCACPGNPGIGAFAECLPAGDGSPQHYLAVADKVNADLTVVGPEAPLVAGVVDAFRAAGRLVVGPTAAAAQLEGSKIFAKRFFERAGIPTARFVAAETAAEALAALDQFGCPVVLKADGLAAGKGVLICESRADAEAGIRGLFSGQLVGSAGSRVVVEEYLTGEEVSFIALADGTNIVPLEPTQDHKTIYDNDTGPNTGGMGAYCDSRILNASQTQQIIDSVMLPAIRQMAAGGVPYTGFLYAGLMLTARGPAVLEFNVRLGDPETQALMHRMDSDFGLLLEAAARGNLTSVPPPRWKPEPSVCVVLAAHGYPGKVRTGDIISGIAESERTGAVVFHAGTRLNGGRLETGGGRVLGVTASGTTLADAIDNAYRAARCIHFEGMQYRSDIGRKGLKRW